MKYLIILLLMISCGTQKIEVEDSKHTSDSNVDIVIDWNLDQMKDIFIDSCTNEFENQIEIDQCVIDKISDLVNLINTGLNQPQQGE